LIAALGSTVQAADGVWKWVDAQGITHYADRPVPGAVQVDIKVQTQSGPASATAAASPAPAAPAQPPGPVYRVLEIWRPTPQETIANTGGVVPLRVRMDPTLRPRHTLAIFLDAKRVEGLLPGADMELRDVPRGTHAVAAAVLDENGRVVQQTPQVVFFVRQESVAQPPVGPALRPPPRP
jgi:hypothetical protein